MRKIHLHNSSQTGMVSIMVTMLLMLVITLIVLGFAQVSRREQIQTLDRQLSAQAFFAAESGVNDAISVIKQRLAQGLPISDKTACSTNPSDPVRLIHLTVRVPPVPLKYQPLGHALTACYGSILYRHQRSRVPQWRR
jgi:Tfp pilus assembly protein PilX